MFFVSVFVFVFDYCNAPIAYIYTYIIINGTFQSVSTLLYQTLTIDKCLLLLVVSIKMADGEKEEAKNLVSKIQNFCTISKN